MKVRSVAPVREVFHPAAIQLRGNSHKTKVFFVNKRGRYTNCRSLGPANGNTKCGDASEELDKCCSAAVYPFKLSLCKQALHELLAYGDTDKRNTIREAEKPPTHRLLDGVHHRAAAVGAVVGHQVFLEGDL